MRNCPLLLPLLVSLVVISCAEPPSPAAKTQPPNIVLIMADDLGFSDLGSYGGEIRTPHIDRLADEGVRFTRFTNTSRCCPSRAALLTGRNQHAVGMGWMTAVDEHRPGYRGQITDAVPTLAEILKQNGYATYMSGKWHLTVDGNFKGVDRLLPNGSWPTERGFDEYFGGLSGGGNYYDVKSLLRNETHITEMPEGFYYTTAITRHALEFVNRHDTQKPFFLYLAHYAPHRSLQAPEDRIAPYRDLYSVGYDALRQKRYERLQEMGILQTDTPLPLHPVDFTSEGGRPAWDSLNAEQKEAWVEEMATYAAMVEIMDDGIGEVVEALKSRGMYENTLILFLSDNGATMEGGLTSRLAAALSNTPYRQFKQFTHAGGINSPLIVRLPKHLANQSGTLNDAPSHIMDILPTCLEFAGIDYPETFKGKGIAPADGMSLLPALGGQPLQERDFFFEHQTSSAIISGDWKLVRLSSDDPWELYQLSIDPFEEKNVADTHPEVARRLEKIWTQWAEANNVFPLESLLWRKRVNHYKEKFPDQDGID